MTNLLKTRTAELKKIEKEKELLNKNLSESELKLKEANDKVSKTETKSTRLETEVDNLIEILGEIIIFLKLGKPERKMKT